MTASTLPSLGITLGDPAGIGPEVVLRALAARPPGVRVRVYGPVAALDACARRCGLEAAGALGVEIFDTPGELPPLAQIAPAGGHAAVRALRAAVRDALAGEIAGIVTAPLHKASLRLAGYAWPGHTELLAEASGVADVAMMFVGGGLRIALVTIHQSLASVPASLTSEAVARVGRLVHEGLPRFGCSRRRIAVCGLNPHAGEGGLFGTEDAEIVAPAVAALRAEGLDVVGPLPADTACVRAARGEFDAVVAQYHDQGLIPVKLAAFGQAVNVTLGLPFVRTSVDHGTAFDIVEQGRADPGSMLAALRLAAELVARPA